MEYITPSVSKPATRIDDSAAVAEKFRRDVMSYIVKAANAADNKWLDTQLPGYRRIGNDSRKWQEITNSMQAAGLIEKSTEGTFVSNPYRNLQDVFSAVEDGTVSLPLPQAEDISQI